MTTFWKGSARKIRSWACGEGYAPAAASHFHREISSTPSVRRTTSPIPPFGHRGGLSRALSRTPSWCQSLGIARRQRTLQRSLSSTRLGVVGEIERWNSSKSVSYTHLTLPTNREV